MVGDVESVKVADMGRGKRELIKEDVVGMILRKVSKGEVTTCARVRMERERILSPVTGKENGVDGDEGGLVVG